jgi:hypothetical protein
MTNYLKTCVFCGKPPNGKNKEHVIPQWLIAQTGSKSREIIANFDKSTGKARKFAFQAFTFPACRQCNSNYSTLESNTQKIFFKLMNDQTITTAEISQLLDWFDKVRVGMWLAQYHLDRNPGGITPNFHMSDRIGTKDRALGIAKIDGSEKGVNWIGVETPLFMRSPSCFGLRIDNFLFFSISFEFLLAKALGFPYPSQYSYSAQHHKSEAQIVYGHERVTLPVLPFSIGFDMQWMFQPVLDRSLLDTEYQTDFVKASCLVSEPTKGTPLVQVAQDMLPASEAAVLQPPFNQGVSIEDFCIAVLQSQIDLQSIAPDDAALPTERRNKYREVTESCIEFNKNQIRLLGTR